VNVELSGRGWEGKIFVFIQNRTSALFTFKTNLELDRDETTKIVE